MGWLCGNYESGRKNAITDVPGVAVGHKTIIEGEGELVPGKGPIRTGVTMILPHGGNVFREKVPTGVFVANGYGKATGIPQIFETGCIETPIAITNTLNVGIVFNAMISHAISENPEIGIKTGSVAPIVTECFDGYLNDIQGRHVRESHVIEAIAKAKVSTGAKQGNIGAGTGMQVFELKSGVGTASRQVPRERYGIKEVYHVGTIVIPNFGRFKDFRFYGNEMASILEKQKYLPKGDDEWVVKLGGGSIIAIIATDLPLNSRQLNRLAHRGALGITRTGSILTHTSGDFVIAFSTQNKIIHDNKEPFLHKTLLNENSLLLSDIFRMTIDSVQEAIYNAMFAAETMVGRDNHTRIALDPNNLPRSPGN
ncbi:MAG: DmpA family aminopeptidase [Candidatus Hodarchaeales archaeon]